MNNFKAFTFLFILLLSTTGCTHEKARILIIGDSISIGFTPFVKEQLADVADVFHNPGNAKHTGYGLENITSWLQEGEWDIIQFNWGLWDLCYRHPDSETQGNRDKINGKITFNLEKYESQLDALVKIIIEKSQAKLIFLTTTYVPDHEAGRFAEDAKKYNNIACSVMKANGVTINDLYKVSKGIHLDHGKGDNNVHYTPKGYEALAQHVSAFLKLEIKLISKN